MRTGNAPPGLWLALGVTWALLCPGCGAEVGEVDPAAWRRQGDAAFEAQRFPEAARAYVTSFALLEPAPAQASERALMAFRSARAYALAAGADPGGAQAEAFAREALAWLDEAEALEPGLRQVHFERARLLDPEAPDGPTPWADAAAASAAYARYLEAAAALGATLPESERERVALARRRLAAAAPPPR